MIESISLTLRRAVEIISYGLMVQVEFLNSFFDRQLIDVSLSTTPPDESSGLHPG